MDEPRIDLQRFGRIVRERREALGLQQEEMKDYGGPSSTTMSQIERAVGKPPSRLILNRLDRGLDWTPGSAQRTLAGGDPQTYTGAAHRPTRAEPPPTEAEPIVRLIDIVNANWLRAEAVVDQAVDLDLPEPFLVRLRALVQGFGAYLADEITGLAVPRAERDEAMAELFRRRDRADQLLREKEDRNVNISDRDQATTSGASPEGDQIKEVGDDQDDAEASRPAGDHHPPADLGPESPTESAAQARRKAAATGVRNALGRKVNEKR